MTSLTATATTPELLTVLANKATHLRIESVKATSEAGSGHPVQLLLSGGYRGGIVFLHDAVRPKQSEVAQQRSLCILERPCGALALCRLGGSRLFPIGTA